MKTLHIYLTRQILASLLMTVGVFTFVLLMGNALKEILPLIVSGQVSFGVVAQAAGLLIPFVWVFALPMGMLTATLLIFGRFSADQELTAVRASGVSLLSLTSPVLLLSLLLCAVSALVNLEIGPRCRDAYNDLRFKLTVEFTKMQLPEGAFIKDFQGYIVYVGKNRGTNLQDVIVYAFEGETNRYYTVRASRGRFEVDQRNRKIKLYLDDAKGVGAGGDISSGNAEIELDGGPTQKDKQKAAKIDDMTFTQLQQELRGHAKLEASAEGNGDAGAVPDAPAGGVFVCVLRVHAGGHTAGHPDAPARDQRRHLHRADAGGGLLRLHHARPVAGYASGMPALPDRVAA